MNEEFMRMAIEEARKNLKKGGGPFGACIVKDGKVLSCTHNTVRSSTDPTAHAEMSAIKEASRKLGSIDLSGCTIYSTTEPCPMCFSAIHWAWIKEIVYGSNIADAKAAGLNEMSVSNEQLNDMIGKEMEITPNFLRDEALLLFKEWVAVGGERY